MPPPLHEDDFSSPPNTEPIRSATSPPPPPTRSSLDHPLAWSSPSRSALRRLSSATTSHQHHHNPHQQPTSFLASLRTTLTTLSQQVLTIYLALPLPQRIALFFASGLLFALGIIFILYSHAIFAALGPVAESWRASGPVAWCLIWLATCVTGFPPIIGYSTCVTVAGFVYGFPGGWPLAASATVAGSTGAFLTSRGVFARYVHRLVGADRRFVALGQVLRRDGVGVLVMIRLCPLPYSLSNGFLATVGSIKAGRFALATACSTPKLLVHVFIGSRLALLAESGDKMTGGDRAINYISMAVFGLLGFGVGVFIYRRTMARAAELAREAELEAGDALLDGGGARENEEGVLGLGDDEDRPLVHPDELDAAAIMDDDDISLWDTEGGDGYRDSWDDEPAVGSKTNGNGSTNGVRR